MGYTQNLKSVWWGIVGVAIGLALWHAYLDHRNHHQMLAFLASRAQMGATRTDTPPEAIPDERGDTTTAESGDRP